MRSVFRIVFAAIEAAVLIGCFGCITPNGARTSRESNATDKNAEIKSVRETDDYRQDGWKTVDEGFRMAVPADWEKVDVQGIDSHVGAYHGETADLEFDDVGVFFGPSPTKESKKAIKEFRRKEAHPKLLKPGEEIWHVDGRIALFWSGKADPNENGVRRFSNVAWLDIPYSDSRGYLYISIFYRSEEELPMVRRVLKSLEWPKDLAGPR